MNYPTYVKNFVHSFALSALLVGFSACGPSSNKDIEKSGFQNPSSIGLSEEGVNSVYNILLQKAKDDDGISPQKKDFQIYEGKEGTITGTVSVALFGGSQEAPECEIVFQDTEGHAKKYKLVKSEEGDIWMHRGFRGELEEGATGAQVSIGEINLLLTAATNKN